MKKWLLAIVFASLIALAACGGSDEGKKSDGDSVDTAKGEEVFKQNCASCHANDLSGGAGPNLQKVGKDHSKEDVEDIVKNGKGNMPAVSISDEDRESVAGWLVEEHK